MSPFLQTSIRRDQRKLRTNKAKKSKSCGWHAENIADSRSAHRVDFL